ncbi:hypothetical protein ACLOJK_039328 [Asimina triloba]
MRPWPPATRVDEVSCLLDVIPHVGSEIRNALLEKPALLTPASQFQTLHLRTQLARTTGPQTIHHLLGPPLQSSSAHTVELDSDNDIGRGGVSCWKTRDYTGYRKSIINCYRHR